MIRNNQLASIWLFIGARWSNVFFQAFIASAKSEIVCPRIEKRQATIRSPTHDIGVLVVLPVVLPKAHRADFKAASLAKCQATAARTCKAPALSCWFRYGKDSNLRAHFKEVAE
jgi:hypothetical protein